MYAKLALRNACRSVRDYALYLTTMMVLTVIIVFANLLSCTSDMIGGAQASSLPLIVALIMAVLLHYINGFMLRRRGRELATYTLLGMNKRTISTMFFVETFLLGLLCFVAGAAVGCLVFYTVTMLTAAVTTANISTVLYLQAVALSLLYFAAVQLVSGALSYVRISKARIGQLMNTERRNEVVAKDAKPTLWTALFLASFGISLLLIWTIANSTNETLAMLSTSMVSLPLLFSIYCFYKCFFLWLGRLRQTAPSLLYCNDRIYLAAQAMSKHKTDTRLYTVLSICLLSSAVCFVTGMAMEYIPDTLFADSQAQWMSFLQVCLSITFIVIYFSILAVKQVISTADGRRGIALMGYLGRSRQQLHKLLLKETCLKFTVPILAAVLVLSACVLPVNSMMNAALSQTNVVVGALAVYTLCFCVLYGVYLAVVYRMTCR